MSSDEQLIKRMRKGDEFAIEEFVRKYYPTIMTYCRKRVQDYNLAEDLTQETFEHFFRSFSQYKHYGKIKNYLYTIAGNLCKDIYRTTNGEIPMDEADMIADGLALKARENSHLLYDTMAGVEEQMDMKRALDKLPEVYREVMILHFFRDLKQTEIAGILNIRIHIVKYRIKKGKKLLQEILKEGIL